MLVLPLVLSLIACGSISTTSTSTSSLLSPSFNVSMESLAATLIMGAVIRIVYDPLAPNWEIQEEKLTEDSYRLDLRMKRYHTGGGGEPMQVLKRHAVKLKREQGYGDYQLIEYTEGIDSKTLGAQRVAEGTIKLVQRQAADSFQLNGR